MKNFFIKIEKILKSNIGILIKAIISVIALSTLLDIKTSNFISIVFIVLIYCFYKHKKTDEEVTMKAFATSLIFTLCTVLGEYTKFLPKSGDFYSVLLFELCLIGLIVLYKAILEQFFSWYKKINIYNEKQDNTKGRKIFVFSFVTCMIIYLVYFFRYYPGNLDFDSLWQMKQALGIEQYNDHHPWVHTLIIKLFYNIGHNIFGSANAGVATYTIFQMTSMSLIFAYVIYTFYKFKVNYKFYLSYCSDPNLISNKGNDIFL